MNQFLFKISVEGGEIKTSQRIQNMVVCDISALPLHRKTVFLTQKKAVEYENGISYLFATRRLHKLRTANVTHMIGLTKTMCLIPILARLNRKKKSCLCVYKK